MKQNKQGFTLIELLVVVLIIGILAAVALPQYQKAVIKSRAVQDLATLDALVKAEEVYFLANNQYTEDLSELDITITPSDQEQWIAVLNEDGNWAAVTGHQTDLGYVGFSFYFNTNQKVCFADPDTPSENICKSFAPKTGTCENINAGDGMACFFF